LLASHRRSDAMLKASSSGRVVAPVEYATGSMWPVIRQYRPLSDHGHHMQRA